MRLLPSEDGGTVQQGHQHSANDRRAVGEGDDSLPTMGMEESKESLTQVGGWKEQVEGKLNFP